MTDATGPKTRARSGTLVAIALLLATSSTGRAGAQAQPAPAPAPLTIAFPGQYAAAPAEWKYPVWPKGCARFEGVERTDCLDFVTADFGRLSRYATANAALHKKVPGETRIVFFGDSITDNWSKPAYGGFFAGKPYVNRGIGGQTTAQMLIRFRDDVIALNPDAVVILAGTNDIAGNAGPVSLDSIQDNFASMAELARAHKIRVVLTSLLPISDDKLDAKGVALRRSVERPPDVLKGLNRWLADYANSNGHVYVDYASAVAGPEGFLRPELNDDGLHPNAAGYAVMAPLAEQAIAKALSSARAR